MSTNNIKEITGVDYENFSYLLADSNARIEKTFTQKELRKIPADTSICGTAKTFTTADNNYVHDPNNAQAGGSFVFTYNANDSYIVDLRDGYFNIQAQYYYYDEVSVGTTNAQSSDYTPKPPRFGNMALLSLFSNISLSLDSQTIQSISQPGFNVNARYALMYKHDQNSEHTAANEGWILNNDNEWVLTNTSINSPSITWTYFDVSNTTKLKYLCTGFITARYKLSDLFPVINSFPPLFNHKITIELQRGAGSEIICNTFTLSNSLCQLICFTKCEYCQESLKVTDQVKEKAKQYYSKEIDTLITYNNEVLTPMGSVPETSSSDHLTIETYAAYKNLLLTIAVPRTTNFSGQFNDSSQYYTYTLDGTTLKLTTVNPNNNDPLLKFDAFKAPANAYHCGYFKELKVGTSSTSIADFTPERDGYINRSSTMFTQDLTDKHKLINNCGFAGSVKVSNYQDVYRRYLQSRHFFLQSPETALDFETFMKEYCVFCVDLSTWDLSAGEKIYVDIQYSDWDSNYNPYYSTNQTQTKEIKDTTNTYTVKTITPVNMAKQVVTSLYSVKVLRLLPDGRTLLADLITSSDKETVPTNTLSIN